MIRSFCSSRTAVSSALSREMSTGSDWVIQLYLLFSSLLIILNYLRTSLRIWRRRLSGSESNEMILMARPKGDLFRESTISWRVSVMVGTVYWVDKTRNGNSREVEVAMEMTTAGGYSPGGGDSNSSLGRTSSRGRTGLGRLIIGRRSLRIMRMTPQMIRVMSNPVWMGNRQQLGLNCIKYWLKYGETDFSSPR